MIWDVTFDFDAQGDPPKVYLCRDGEMMAEMLCDEPICSHPDGWSWDEDDWKPGPETAAVVDLLNGAGSTTAPRCRAGSG